MKKLNIFVLVLLLLAFCSCKKEEKLNVTIHYDQMVQTVEVNKFDLVNFEPLDNESYVFLGWYDENFRTCLDNTEITSDMDVYALVHERGVEYKISYELDGGYFTSSRPNKYYTGDEFEITIPEKEDYYGFDHWELNGKPFKKITKDLEGDITLKAIWKDIAIYYNITINALGGEVSKTDFVLRQGEGFNVETPKKEGYYFRGWYLDEELNNQFVGEISDTSTTLYAKWVEKDVKNTYISFLGDSITTFAGYIPEGYIEYYPQGDVQSVEDTWWYQVVNDLGMTLVQNDSYSGTLVSGGNNYGASEERVDLISKDGIIPDVLIIHMGTNDYTHSTNDKVFKEKYEEMIKMILEKYDDIEIFVCTLPKANYDDSLTPYRTKINTAIESIATKYNLHLLDLRTVITDTNYRTNMYAGAHPNKIGMTKISKYVKEKLTEVIKNENK